MNAINDLTKQNEIIKSIFGIDVYYNTRTYSALNSNAYYSSIFQILTDSLQIILLSENKEVAELYNPHFESILGYMNIYKDYSFNSPEYMLELRIAEKWKRREFIGLMREFFSTEKPEQIIHFLGQMFLIEIPDIKISSWKFGKYPAHYHDKTKLWAMLVHHTNLVEYWNEFQQFHKLKRKHYPEGVTKRGTHKIPKKKDICQMVQLYAYVPDIWLDLARIAKQERKIDTAITYFRTALCLDHFRYDIWKELILFDPTYPNTNIPQLDDEINITINNKIARAEKQKAEEEAQETVQQVQTLVNRHNAFNEMSQVMRADETQQQQTPMTGAQNALPNYFEFLRGVPGINPNELYNKIEKAIATLPKKDFEVVQHLAMVGQKAFETGKLDLALETFLSIIHLSAKIGEKRNKIIAMCNLGIYFSNARRYDIARNFAIEANNLATRNNLLEEKLHALKVLGLIQTNDNKDPKQRIVIMEETAETLRQLGREEERRQILAQMEQFKQFLDILGK
ncbi:MAG: hypothetical protein EAX90_10870 [Candidatus Heimdallarchaeota archaeon]|nr:hypothetical protein [Candidatus Heimdallarchaeota archaeon]